MNIDESVEIKASSVGKNMIEEPQEEKSSVKTWKQNRSSKLKFSYKEQREYETIDDDIAGLEEKLKSWIMISWRMLQIPVNLTNLQRKKRLQKHFWKKKWIAGFI